MLNNWIRSFYFPWEFSTKKKYSYLNFITTVLNDTGHEEKTLAEELN